MAARNRYLRNRHKAAFAASVLLVAILLAPASVGDDRELLRDNGADPYLFILLDTSMSMALQLDGTWAEANENDPRSRIYLAKEVLYEILSRPDFDNIRFGFASFGQDQVRVGSKHWLYYVEDPAANTDNALPLATLQGALGYPMAEPNNQIEVSTAALVEIDGDLMTFGKSFASPATAGTCDTKDIGSGARPGPLDLGDPDDRQRINRFSRLGIGSDEDTVLWVVADDPGGLDPVYRLTFSNADTTVPLGSPTIDVTIKAEKLIACGDPPNGVLVSFEPDPIEVTLSFGKWREFLMSDDSGGEVVFEKSGVGAGGGNSCGKDDACEKTGGWWDHRDVEGLFTCGDSKPFSGGGWEGNYDTGEPFTTNATFENGLIPGSLASLVDTHCTGSSDATCELLLDTTEYDVSISRRELDRGDMLPFHWTFRNRNEFLARLNPNHLVDDTNPQFGASFYFEDTPNAHCTGTGTPDPCCTGTGTGTCTRLQLKAPYRGVGALDPPLFAPVLPGGISPVSDSILDFRCWFQGPNNKCGRGGLENIYTKGFKTLLEENDPAAFRCRQPYLIVISDMAQNCPGNSPVANAAGMNTETRDGNIKSTGVSTWLLNVGTGSVGGLTNSGKGEEVRISTKDQLENTIEDILGIIQESTRSFSSAAVPSAQADVEDKIYVTQFTPRQEASVWQGQVHAFLKPLPTAPIDPNDPAAGVAPDTSHPNHKWDAAEVLKTQAPPSTLTVDLVADPDGLSRTDLQLGNGINQRRVFYPIRDSDPTTDSDGDTLADNDLDVRVPRVKYVLGPAEGSTPSPMDLNQVRKDMWVGLGIIPETFTFTNTPGSAGELFTNHRTQAERAHNVFANTYKMKRIQPRDNGGNPIGLPVEYVLGDIFHATPLLVGNPTNARYISRSEPGELFEGYTEYAAVQAKRRKVLFVASDDGMVHAFDAGRFEGSLDDGSFNDGTGKEIFAIAPREILPTITKLAEPPIGHRWGIDGTPVAADVKIDPSHLGYGSADPPDPDQRQWRTVLIGGMRRGGNAYYALDVSRPDRMLEETVTVGSVTFDLGFKPDDGSRVLPGCFQASGDPVNNPGDCDPSGLNYPEILWEFTDDDMGQTWSTPDLGAIKVIENGAEVVKFVAVFGGGLDPDGFLNAADNPLGSRLYIVDIETGAMLYKRDLLGSAAAPPATVDTDQDGILDRIYMGTTEGLMYRVNIGVPQNLVTGGSCSATPPVGSTDSCCASARGPVDGCVNDPAWEPFEIFDTVTTETDADNVSHQVRKPIFFAPSVIFVSRLNSYALAFGTGKRNELWSAAPLGGNRFYLFVDDSDVLNPADPPRVQADLTEVTSPVGVEQDLLIDPDDGERGWFITLGTLAASDPNFGVGNEKVLTQTTAVAGLTVFSTFVPEILTTTTGTGQDIEIRCARRGISRIYTQFAANGVPIPQPDPLDPSAPLEICTDPPCTRQPEEVSTLVSEPFIEEAASPCPGTDGMAEILMSQLFPPTCKFTAKRWNLSAMRADTGVECFAQIPVCLVEKNWKDY